MEGRSIEQMVAVSQAVKGGMDNYLTKLGAKTKENLSVFDAMRGSSAKENVGLTVKNSGKSATKEV